MNTRNKKLAKLGIIVLAAGLSSLLFAQFADAAYQIPKTFMPDNTPLNLDFTKDSQNTGDPGTSALILVLQIVAGALIYFAAPIAILSIALIAFDLAMGSANTEKVETAKKRMIWLVLGLLTIMFSYGLIKFLIGFVFQIFN
jgi:hypothetical protein